MDDDNDGVSDTFDAFPDSAETLDTDITGNNADTDDDGDGVEDNADAFPLDSAETLDTDLTTPIQTTMVMALKITQMRSLWIQLRR